MSLQKITAADVANWTSLDDIATAFEKRGLKPQPNLGEDNELVLQLSDDEFMILVEAGPGESATDFKPKDADRRHTNLVATNDFEEFTFITRVRTFDQQHGQIKHQKLSFSKSQFASQSGEKNTILQKLNEIEYGQPTAIFGDLYDTRQIVSEFYEQFEALRTDLVQEVANIPDDRGDAKQRYVQVTLDRMIFLYFIQEKRLLDRNLDYLREYHDEEAEASNDVYEQFYEPLFFDALGEGDHIKRFKNVPYLNGGLFSKNPIEEEFPDAKLGASTAETNALFDRILDFLSDWNWNVDERLDIVDPKNLSPAVLGHIFEQTVNQKEMGAYYTPEEITGFMARRSIHPYLLDQLNETVDADYDEIDEVFGLDEAATSATADEAVADGGTITQQAPTDQVQTEHVETLYFDILRDTRVLDPAVGSGAFLLAAQDVLLDIYLQCLEFFETVEDEGAGWQLSNRTREELEQIQGRKAGKSLYAKREIILNNLYGVDIDDGAVEICKLRLWLSMVADIEDEPSEVDPLPNIDFNIRQGNSLVGIAEPSDTMFGQGNQTLDSFGGGVEDAVRARLEDVVEAIREHKNASSSVEASEWRKEAESRMEAYRTDLDAKLVEAYDKHADGDGLSNQEVRMFDQFHWVLEFAEVYADRGGFDIIIGNPPWDRIKPNRDDFFTTFDPAFRTLRGSVKDERQEELLQESSVRKGWEQYQEEMKRRAAYFNHSPHYNKQSSEIGGRTQATENDLSSLFLERLFDLAGEEGYVAQILPGRIFTGSPTKQLRLHLLEETTVESIIGFENHGIFKGIDNRYKFGITIFRNSGTTTELNGVFQRMDVDFLRHADQELFKIPREVLTQFSPSSALFPMIRSVEEVSVIRKLVSHPAISDKSESWYADPYYALHKTGDKERFFSDPEEGDYPIFTGRNFYQFCYDPTFFDDLEPVFQWGIDEDRLPERSAKRRIREKQVRKLKRAVYEAFDGNGSMKGFVNELLQQHRGHDLGIDDVKLDATEYRVGFRRVSNSTNERTMVASLAPTTGVCDYSFYILRPFNIDPSPSDLKKETLHDAYKRIFSDEELCVTVGMLNSIPFDFLMRRKVDNSIPMYSFKETQVPHLSHGDDWFHYISDRAARLNCYGEAFAEMRDRLGGIDPATDAKTRRRLQAEIDAAAFHAYGLDHDEVEFVLDDFHRVQNPRIMTEEYFDAVLAKYEELAETGPME